ncbi:MAG: LysW-gamma-L-alpha-aminoadipyl-6-phosphate/LysW-L-glutamyl-5-phosphate reductase [Acidobacteriota bacterium]|jgi:N-acetyl-gamma-glutamyl-phosphate reductase|nr:LysW-gamma-L-alpha-aminoadipyl-6-phosphate/LysW-L-glutamyl-5-phosphate reductase [Acidobacteriota bacterium]
MALGIESGIENTEDANSLRVSASPRLRVAVFGGSGYGGAELLRLLLMHPQVEVALVTANEQAGKAVGDVHKNLYGLTDLRFTVAPEELESLTDFDFIFLSLPHGQAIDLVPRLPRDVKVIDLSGDFRLRDREVFEQFYQREHTAMETQADFVYGLTETNREAIKSATRISNPGCFATATLLGLAPLVANNLIDGRVIVDAKTGSSGSGAKPAANTHHPQRMNSFYAYKPFTHQHVPEIEQELRAVGDWTSELVFMTHSLPVARGIFASIYVEARDEMTTKEVRDVFAEFYKDSFFVRLVEGSPDINWVKTTNFCDIGFAARGRQLAVFSAIDNLVKGAAGQAVQNMNLMAGLDEKTGLILTGSNP